MTAIQEVSASTIRCYLNTDWEETGLARVAIARWNSKRGITATGFLVDIKCLGVKDVMEGVFRSPKDVEADFVPMLYFDCQPKSISFQEAREIVCGAICYARDLGFEPHPDFSTAGQFLEIEGYAPDGSVRFGGPGGKPLYIAGPFDPADEIIRTLEARVGKDGFEFVYPLEEFIG